VISLDLSEAARLVDLKAAKFVDTSQTASNSERVSDKLKDTENRKPVITWKKEQIWNYLNEMKIPFDTKATKETLIKVYEEWKKKQ
jgi:hypothetical protein